MCRKYKPQYKFLLPFWQTNSILSDLVWCGRRAAEGMIELKTLQTVRMRNIHLFWCQRGNLEAVRVSPSPTPALTGTEPGYRHIHQHTFQEQISRNVGNTYKSHNQYCGHLNWTWGVSGAGKYFEREQSKCLFYLLAFLKPVVLKMWHLSPVADGGDQTEGL